VLGVRRLAAALVAPYVDPTPLWGAAAAPA